jgi:hypothetical protein
MRYPEDQLSIYQCFRDFGAKHNDFIGKSRLVMCRAKKNIIHINTLS